MVAYPRSRNLLKIQLIIYKDGLLEMKWNETKDLYPAHMQQRLQSSKNCPFQSGSPKHNIYSHINQNFDETTKWQYWYIYNFNNMTHINIDYKISFKIV